MHRAFVRSQYSQLIVWTGDDGPIRASADAVGVEYRGRLGHPSSYGLLVGRAARGHEGTFSLDPKPGTLMVAGDHVTLGLTEPEYHGALGAASALLGGGLVISGAAEGRYGSSSVVFAKLAALLSVLLCAGPDVIDEARLWVTWDEPWRACCVSG
ncbi:MULTISPECIES: hypothetical protein [unclassified Micromonospora]|uniref:hypothetical protein n=1 Tax=unclassified Micromonospora TaxID=2617518 RepID=UPI003625E032